MKLFQVDAFTSNKFSGNPAGVCLVDDFPEESLMQNIALEMNLSETAFVKHTSGENYEIRFFTPSSEVDLCGHATLSSAHILFSTGIIFSEKEITFLSKVGELKVQKSLAGYSMQFPLWTFEDISEIENAEKITGIFPVQSVYSTNKKWKILLIDGGKQALEKLSPNFSKMTGTAYGNVAVTCLGEEKYDYFMRCFVTDCGINEDPVTGSIECVLAPFWKEKLGKTKFLNYQCSQRGGEKEVEVGDGTVRISGNAVTVFETEI